MFKAPSLAVPPSDVKFCLHGSSLPFEQAQTTTLIQMQVEPGALLTGDEASCSEIASVVQSGSQTFKELHKKRLVAVAGVEDAHAVFQLKGYCFSGSILQKVMLYKMQQWMEPE